jgi:hypothetical protein
VVGGILKLHGTDEQLGALFASLATAQANFQTVDKDNEVDSGSRGKWKYSTLEDFNVATRPALGAEGLAVISGYRSGENVNRVVMLATEHMLGHSSGARISFCDEVPVHTNSKNGVVGIQDVGAAITYSRRYGLTSLINASSAVDDDDGVSSQIAAGGPNSVPMKTSLALAWWNRYVKPLEEDSPELFEQVWRMNAKLAGQGRNDEERKTQIKQTFPQIDPAKKGQ